ncbi:MAG: zf-HC2 domain-containing protein, partial [Brevibacterium aurantiacum]|nr:zf-HC2 domain-containing protein [Brevibacterium aurantiacum]
MSDECCENVRAESLMRIYHYLDGELTTTEIREISVHLEQCPSCHDEYEIEALLKELVRRSC